MRSRAYCGYCAISGDIWIRDYISNRVDRNPNQEDLDDKYFCPFLFWDMSSVLHSGIICFRHNDCVIDCQEKVHLKMIYILYLVDICLKH